MPDVRTMTTVKTLVVGTGPAGCLAAYGAAAAGPVLMVDTFTLPRDKSCGGMIHPLSQGILAEIAPLPEELLLTPPRVYFRYNDWDRKVIKNTDLYFLNVDRKPFDEWLLAQLPPEVIVQDATTFLRHELEPDGRIRAWLRHHQDAGGDDFSVLCDYLVGCDGPRSTVRRSLNLPAFPRYITLQDYCVREGEIDPVFDCFWFSGIPEFGVGYIIPKDERVLVGLVYYPGTKQAHKLQDFALEKLRGSLPIGRSLKREAWIAPKHSTIAQVSPGAGRVLLAGEAGGYISPTSGEGISWALASGKAAGQAIAVAASSDGADGVLPLYAQAVEPLRKDIARRLRWFPLMNSRWGKTAANYIPEKIISHFTHSL